MSNADIENADKNKRKIELGGFLMELRKNRGLSVKEVADAIGMSTPYLYQLEDGQKTLTDPKYFKKFSTFYRVPVEDLLLKAGYLFPLDDWVQQIDEAYRQLLVAEPDLPPDPPITTKQTLIRLYEAGSGKKLLPLPKTHKPLKNKSKGVK